MTAEQLEQLRRYLDAKELTQRDIAKATRVTPARVNALLTGRKNFGRTTAAQWQELFGVSSAWLLTGEGDVAGVQHLTTEKFLSELAAQRHLTEKAQQHIDRLLALLEKKKIAENLAAVGEETKSVQKK